MYSGPATQNNQDNNEIEPQYENGLEIPHIYRPDVNYVKDQAEIERQRKWKEKGFGPPERYNKNNPVFNKQNENSLPDPLPVQSGTGMPQNVKKRFDDGNGAL